MAKSKSTPTPTLEQLRKLEARKGSLDFDQYERGTRIYTELWWAETTTHFATFHDTLEKAEVRRAIFAVLSSLPDAEVPRG